MSNKKTILDAVFRQYRRQTNMTVKELKAWAKNPLSKKLSRNRKPLMMAIRLASKPKKRWGLTEIRWALKKAIPFLKRSKQKKSIRRVRKKLTKNQFNLMNWGFNVKKKRRK